MSSTPSPSPNIAFASCSSTLTDGGTTNIFAALQINDTGLARYNGRGPFPLENSFATACQTGDAGALPIVNGTDGGNFGCGVPGANNCIVSGGPGQACGTGNACVAPAVCDTTSNPPTCRAPVVTHGTPAMDGWALAGLALILGASGLMVVRRRSAKV
jgi:hypothetical protein